MFDKRYQVGVTFFTVNHFPNSVDAAMSNIPKYPYLIWAITFVILNMAGVVIRHMQ
jgi:hypothetical protein